MVQKIFRFFSVDSGKKTCSFHCRSTFFSWFIINKFKYFLLKAEQLGPTEVKETFFAMTKLFQSKDVSLKNGEKFYIGTNKY